MLVCLIHVYDNEFQIFISKIKEIMVSATTYKQALTVIQFEYVSNMTDFRYFIFHFRYLSQHCNNSLLCIVERLLLLI